MAPLLLNVFRILIPTLVTLYAATGVQRVTDLPINVVIIINGDNPAYGYYLQAPAFDASFANMQLIYPNILAKVNRHMIHKPGNFTCTEAAALMNIVAGEADKLIRRLNGTTILISPGCNLETMVLGDFAREWDVPLLSPISGDQTFTNRDRYPSVVVFPSTDYPTYIAGLRTFLQQFKWTTITLICDSLSHSPLAPYFQSMCRNIQRLFDQFRGSFLTYNIHLDSDTNSSVDYDELLAPVRKQSRVIIIETRPDVIRKFMISAHLANMTDGEYVFIASEITRLPMAEDLDWRYNNSADLKVLRAFRSLIVVSSPNPDWDRIDPLLRDIQNISEARYGIRQTERQRRNALTVSTYEVVSALAQVLNENADSPSTQPISGRQVASWFLNRTFALPSRDVYIAPNGVRASDVIFSRLNRETDQLQTTWRYSATSANLLEISSVLATDWVSSNGPPPNQPLCGFTNELCFNTDGKKILQGAIGGSLSAFVALVLLPAAIWFYRNQNEENCLPWWELDSMVLKQSCCSAYSVTFTF